MTDDGTSQDREDPFIPDPTARNQDATPESVYTGAPKPAGGGKSRLALFIVALVALLLVGGGAVAGVLYALRGTNDVLIDKVPADSLAYVTVYLDPAAGQKINIIRLAEKFPALRGEDLGGSLDQVMNQALDGSGMSFQDDIEPWMGSQIGGVLVMGDGEPHAALLVDSEDDAAAGITMDELAAREGDVKNIEYGGTTIVASDSFAMATVDGTVVLSDSQSVVEKIIDTAGGGRNLSGSEAYRNTMLALPDERLAVGFVNGTEVVNAIERQSGAAGLGAADQQLFGPIRAFEGLGMTLSAETDGVSMKFASSIDTSKLPDNPDEIDPHENAVLAWAPNDSYGLMAGTGLGGNLKGLKDQMEELSPGSGAALDLFGVGAAINALQGDYGLVVSPMAVDLGADAGTDAIPAGAFMMASNDDAAMQDFMDSVSVLVARAMADGLMERTVTTSEKAVPLVDDMTPIKMVTPTWRSEDYQGVTISFLPLPGRDAGELGLTPAYAVSDGMAIIATSPDEVKALLDARGGGSISDNANFKSAITHADEQNTGMIFVNIEQILNAVKASAGPNGISDEMSNMEPVRSVVMTSGGTSARPKATVFVLIR